MKKEDINIRDPFILAENGKYYLYGTRARSFGIETGGFDVYVSEDLIDWSEPCECFDSEAFSLNSRVNWAPEVHKYGGRYYMFATLTQENGLKGTYILSADSPMGPFVPHSRGAVTPKEWESLDGTLYIGKDEKPYVVFCHEHSQIVDGTVCFSRLSDDLTESVGEPVTLFAASSCPWVDKHEGTGHFVTDGPFMYRTKDGELLMIWSSFIKEQYAELQVRFTGGEIGTDFVHLPPIIDDDGGHGMIFEKDGELSLIFHSPNTKGLERPAFIRLLDVGDSLAAVK